MEQPGFRIARAGASLTSMRTYVVALLALASVAPAADGQWQQLDQCDGITIERRSTWDSSIRELRLTASSPVPPAAMMATIWRHDEYVQFLPYLKRLDVLRDEGDAKLIYEQIHVPVVKDRDVTLRVTRTSSPDTGTYEVSSVAVPDEGPSESRDYVRVRTSLARWRLAPAVGGGTTVTYTLRTDAGGRLPSWIFDALQKDAGVKVFRAMLDRARQNRD
jgi:ribosome-associated toxin RatA of RatAB toxin-antitoxin module